MCGIAGIIGKSDTETVQRMLKATRHRGPDDNGMQDLGWGTIGMNRLSIIDLSASGHQPMLSDDGRYVIVYNGEISNFQEHKASLEAQGVVFNGHSDTEVLLRLFERDGIACLNVLNGMFAFVIADLEKKTVYGGRDRFGIKPFYYSMTGKQFTFCSELKGMLVAKAVSKSIDIDALNEYIHYGYITTPNTIFENVKNILPGYYFKYDIEEGDLQFHKYWDVYEQTNTGLEYQDAVTAVKQNLLRSVEENLISDVPVGLFLSGGLDSTVVGTCMKELGHANFHTFSVGFDADGSHIDETTNANAIAGFLKSNHHHHVVDSHHFYKIFDDFITALDQPSIDGLNSYLVSEVASKYVKVSLSGLGGDELFMGYGWQQEIYANLKSTGMAKYIPGNLPLPFKFQYKLQYLRSAGDVNALYSYNNMTYSPYDTQQLLAAPYRQNIFSILDKRKALLESYEMAATQNPLQAVSKADIKVFMAGRLREGDATSMRHSLEVRFPFLDYRLLEVLSATKAKDFFRQDDFEDNYGSKSLLQQAFRAELPFKLLNTKKTGFHLPLYQWLSKHNGKIVAENTAYLKATHFFDNDQLQKIIDKWLQGDKSLTTLVFGLCVLGRWLHKYDLN